jgi:hypothetical protein
LLCSAVVEDTPSTPTCTTGTGAARDGPVCPPFVAVDLFRRLLRPSPPHRAAALISFLSSPQHLCAPAEQLCQDSTHRVLSVSHLSSLLIPLHALRRTPCNSLSSSPPPTLRGRVTETFSDASHLQPYLTSHHTKGPRGKKRKKKRSAFALTATGHLHQNHTVDLIHHNPSLAENVVGCCALDRP